MCTNGFFIQTGLSLTDVNTEGNTNSKVSGLKGDGTLSSSTNLSLTGPVEEPWRKGFVPRTSRRYCARTPDRDGIGTFGRVPKRVEGSTKD